MPGNDARTGRDEPSDAASGGDLSGRLQRLGSELEAKRKAGPGGMTRVDSRQDPSALGRAFRASTEFVAGIIAGGLLGWLVDKGLGSSPWGLIVFLMLGFAAGVYNVLRSAGLPTPGGGGGGQGSGS